MASDLGGLKEPQNSALRELARLRNFTGPPRDFWPRYLEGLAGVTSASAVVLLVQDPAQPSSWQRLGEWSANLGPSRFLATFRAQLDSLAADCAKTGEGLVASLESGPPRGPGHYAIGAAPKLPSTRGISVIILLLSEFTETAAREALFRLRLALDVPESFRLQQSLQQSSEEVHKLTTGLDMVLSVNAEKRFLATALAFCNGLASHFRCERASLGWLEGGYIRLRAMSRTERFDRKMAVIQALETAMDEALDQDEEVLWPPQEGRSTVLRDHEKYAREYAPGHLCSLPLRRDSNPVAVVTCERRESPFTASELEQLRLGCDMASCRLAELHGHDRWFGARLAAWVKDQLAVIVGPRHTWAKLTAVLAAILLALLFFLRVPYRVEGNFVLKSDEVSFRTAPFDGYIERVFVRPGDMVKAGDPLLKLVTRELELEKLAAVADLARFQREADKARATNDLAGMRIATAMGEQSEARGDLVNYRLAEATLKAPFDGVIVEGDLRDRLAAPVRQGDALMKVARLENLYVQAEVSERDVQEVLGKDRGEIAFVSQPKLAFPVRVQRLESAASPRPEGSVFLARCGFEHGVEKWWRPGMTGLCKFQVERRTLWWILTHRTVDFLRLKLWW